MYAFWCWLKGLFLRRRCTVTLTNGAVVRWVRPKDTSVASYRSKFEDWRAARGHRLKLTAADYSVVTISADAVVSVEIR